MMNLLQYEYKGNKYELLYAGKMKVNEDWIECFIYRSHKDDKIYVRSTADFVEKFKLIR